MGLGERGVTDEKGEREERSGPPDPPLDTPMII